MALNFQPADLQMLATLGASSPDPYGFWTWVKNNSTNTDVDDVAAKMQALWTTADASYFDEIRLIREALQELQAIIPTVDISYRRTNDKWDEEFDVTFTLPA